MKITIRITGIKTVAILLVLMLGPATAFANGKNLKGWVSLSQEAQVNGVKLKPGRYEARFDAETNEVSISDGSRVLVTVKASVRKGEGKPRQNQAFISNTDKGALLSKLVFKGDDRGIIINEGGGPVARQ